MVALLAAGCGGEEGGGDDLRKVLADAVAKTEAAKTARMAFAISITGHESARFNGEALVDFGHDRDLLTMKVQGQTVQLFIDRGDEYVRSGTSGRYRRLPASAQSPVANNPADSLKYVGTDVVDVVQAKQSGCYAGRLDFGRVFERVEAGRAGEFPRELRGQRAPVVVCVDGAGRIRRYHVDLSLEGGRVEVNATISDHGRAPPLEPLGPGELPR